MTKITCMSPGQLQKLSDKAENQKHLRSLTTRKNLDEAENGLSMEAKKIIREAVSTLDDESKAIVHLKFWEDLSNDEIAYQIKKTSRFVDEKLKTIYFDLKSVLKDRFNNLVITEGQDK
jgi:DNA-directed RNA polymerase specialized sigma24 family protein